MTMEHIILEGDTVTVEKYPTELRLVDEPLDGSDPYNSAINPILTDKRMSEFDARRALKK